MGTKSGISAHKHTRNVVIEFLLCFRAFKLLSFKAAVIVYTIHKHILLRVFTCNSSGSFDGIPRPPCICPRLVASF